MPKMGDAMEEGTLLKWLVSEGDEVSEGDSIAEIETDKLTMELEAEDSGTLAQITAQEGQDVPVGDSIAFIQGEGEEVPERDGSGGAEAQAEEGSDEAPQAQTATAEEEETREAEPRQPETGGEPSGDGAPARADGQVRASPIVRRLARENNLDLSQIEGSGQQGRIVERDVRAAMERGEAQMADGQAEASAEAPAEASAEAPAEEQPQEATQEVFQPPHLPEPTSAPGTELVQPSRMQQVIGERMTQAKQQAPHFYATVEVRM